MTRRFAALALALSVSAPLAAQVADGNRAWAAGRYQEARADYEAALRTDPASVRSLYRLAVLASWDNHLDSALALLQRARTLEPADPDVRVTEAQVLAWQGHHRAALVRYDSLVTEFPGRRDVLLGRAQTLGWAGQYRAADSAYRRLLLDNPDDADANAGLAQIAHWSGRDAEAEHDVRRALAIAPSNRDAIALADELRAARRPSVELTGGWNNDSDHNTNWSEGLTLSTGIAPGVGVFASGGLQQSRDPTRRGNRTLAEAGVNAATGRLRVTAAAGARELRPDAAASRTEVTYRAAASLRPSGGLGVGAGFSHLPLDETALLIGADLDIDAVDANLDARLGSGTNLGLGGGAAWISDGNRRLSAVAALTTTVRRHAFVGIYGRLLGYRQHGIGYFSPQRFGVAEARAGYSAASRGWEGKLSGGLGVQQTEGSSAQAEWHVEGRAARRWSARGTFELFGGVTNSLASSVNGAFRYRYAGLRLLIGL